MASLLLSIDEVEGRTTAISHYTSVGSGPVTTLREKVFCVLGTNHPAISYSPVQSLKFTPKHISALTINIRIYEAQRNIYRPLDANHAKIGLWFKLTLHKCVGELDDEYVYVVYSPSLEHHRFDLGFRKMISAIELTHYEVFEPLFVKLATDTTANDDDGDGDVDDGANDGIDGDVDSDGQPDPPSTP